MTRRKSHDPDWLRWRGFDGLYSAEPCGCGLDDFAPCGEGPFPGCVPARLKDDGLFYPATAGWARKAHAEDR